jgi:hypothetical protein
VGDGGALVTGVSALKGAFCRDLRRHLETCQMGWTVDHTADSDASLAEILRAALHIEDAKGIGQIALDPTGEGHVVIVEIKAEISGISLQPVLRDARRFWSKRGPDCADLILVLPDTLPGREDPLKAPVHLCWRARGFARIDRMIWALTHLHHRETPLAYLAEALAVEVGAQDLDRVSRIASSTRDELIHGADLLEKICPEVPAELRHEQLWRGHVRALLPWIEEHRQTFVAAYGRHLVLDHHQRTLRVESVEDIEIGGLAFQLTRAGVLSSQERDLIEALRCVRTAVAHATPATPYDLETALSRSSVIRGLAR